MDTGALRHAYLIITHGNFPILEKQLRLLDSRNADFYIHLDTHVKDFDFDYYRSIPRWSSVIFVDRIRISWGHDSLAECELILLRAAAERRYDYYHLLSGVDMPIKSREYIESFFNGSDGTNYLNFERPVISPEHLERVRYYYPLQRLNIRNRPLRLGLRLATTYAQKLVGVDRTRKYDRDFVFQKGTQWFSITDDLVRYLLSRESEIRTKFRSTFCTDEVFLHSMVMNSPFRDTLPPDAFNGRHSNCLRYIDWTRGKPYTFTDDDYDELIQAGPECLFARKFDYARYPGVVDRLFEHLRGEGSPRE